MKSNLSTLNVSKYIFLFFALAFSNMHAQLTISGCVTDETGPLPGVTIIEKGTSNGITSDFYGNFTISVNDENSILVLSYIGFLTQEIDAKSDSFNITMFSGAD